METTAFIFPSFATLRTLTSVIIINLPSHFLLLYEKTNLLPYRIYRSFFSTTILIPSFSI